jgi:hypothetical protein
VVGSAQDSAPAAALAVEASLKSAWRGWRRRLCLDLRQAVFEQLQLAMRHGYLIVSFLQCGAHGLDGLCDFLTRLGAKRNVSLLHLSAISFTRLPSI